jgi:hypothetical protein
LGDMSTADMSTADWVVLAVHAVATVAAALSALFAWRAADTSRAIAEDQRRLVELARLEEMHAALVHLGTVLAATPTWVIEFDEGDGW